MRLVRRLLSSIDGLILSAESTEDRVHVREKIIRQKKQGKEEGKWVKTDDSRSECDAMLCTIQ